MPYDTNKGTQKQHPSTSTGVKTAILNFVVLAIAGVLLSCSESASPPASHNTTRLLPERVAPDMASLPPSVVYLPAFGGGSVTVANYPFTEEVVVDITIAGTISHLGVTRWQLRSTIPGRLIT